MDVMRDNDPAETREWRQALDSVLAFEGPERAEFLLEALADEARRKGALVPYTANTPYLNTIPPAQEARHPGNGEAFGPGGYITHGPGVVHGPHSSKNGCRVLTV